MGRDLTTVEKRWKSSITEEQVTIFEAAVGLDKKGVDASILGVKDIGACNFIWSCY